MQRNSGSTLNSWISELLNICLRVSSSVSLHFRDFLNVTFTAQSVTTHQIHNKGGSWHKSFFCEYTFTLHIYLYHNYLEIIMCLCMYVYFYKSEFKFQWWKEFNLWHLTCLSMRQLNNVVTSNIGQYIYTVYMHIYILFVVMIDINYS